LDLHPVLGRLLDLLGPGIERMRRPPAGRRVLVREGELELLRLRQGDEGQRGGSDADPAQRWSDSHELSSLVAACARDTRCAQLGVRVAAILVGFSRSNKGPGLRVQPKTCCASRSINRFSWPRSVATPKT